MLYEMWHKKWKFWQFLETLSPHRNVISFLFVYKHWYSCKVKANYPIFPNIFSLTKMGIALMVWESFYNVKNGKQILLIPSKTWGCAQYPRWCECWNYIWLDPFFKSWPLGKLLAEMLQRVSISYKNSPAKDSDLKVKNKILDFWTFLHQIPQ